MAHRSAGYADSTELTETNETGAQRRPQIMGNSLILPAAARRLGLDADANQPTNAPSGASAAPPGSTFMLGLPLRSRSSGPAGSSTAATHRPRATLFSVLPGDSLDTILAHVDDPTVVSLARADPAVRHVSSEVHNRAHLGSTHFSDLQGRSLELLLREVGAAQTLANLVQAEPLLEDSREVRERYKDLLYEGSPVDDQSMWRMAHATQVLPTRRFLEMARQHGQQMPAALEQSLAEHASQMNGDTLELCAPDAGVNRFVRSGGWQLVAEKLAARMPNLKNLHVPTYRMDPQFEVAARHPVYDTLADHPNLTSVRVGYLEWRRDNAQRDWIPGMY